LNTRKQEKITVNVSDLDPALVEKIKSEQSMKEVRQKINTYGEWVGVGKEIGSAVDGGLTALTKHADNIANTNVGKFTMVMIAYKVLGNDIMGVTFGFIFWFMGTLLFIWIFYKNGINKHVYDIRYSEDGKTIVRKDETIKYPEDGAPILITLGYFVWAGVCALIMFA
jgi:hypothetical protein